MRLITVVGVLAFAQAVQCQWFDYYYPRNGRDGSYEEEHYHILPFDTFNPFEPYYSPPFNPFGGNKNSPWEKESQGQKQTENRHPYGYDNSEEYYNPHPIEREPDFRRETEEPRYIPIVGPLGTASPRRGNNNNNNGKDSRDVKKDEKKHKNHKKNDKDEKKQKNLDLPFGQLNCICKPKVVKGKVQNFFANLDCKCNGQVGGDGIKGGKKDKSSSESSEEVVGRQTRAPKWSPGIIPGLGRDGIKGDKIGHGKVRDERRESTTVNPFEREGRRNNNKNNRGNRHDAFETTASPFERDNRNGRDGRNHRHESYETTRLPFEREERRNNNKNGRNNRHDAFETTASPFGRDNRNGRDGRHHWNAYETSAAPVGRDERSENRGEQYVTGQPGQKKKSWREVLRELKNKVKEKLPWNKNGENREVTDEVEQERQSTQQPQRRIFNTRRPQPPRIRDTPATESVRSQTPAAEKHEQKNHYETRRPTNSRGTKSDETYDRPGKSMPREVGVPKSGKRHHSDEDCDIAEHNHKKSRSEIIDKIRPVKSIDQPKLESPVDEPRPTFASAPKKYLDERKKSYAEALKQGLENAKAELGKVRNDMDKTADKVKEIVKEAVTKVYTRIL